MPYFATSTELAEQLRSHTPQVVFVLGCEMSLSNSGVIPGAHFLERIQTLMNPALLASQSVSPAELEQWHKSQSLA